MKSGPYTPRLGVVDSHSGKLGTLEVPVTIPPTK